MLSNTIQEIEKLYTEAQEEAVSIKEAYGESPGHLQNSEYRYYVGQTIAYYKALNILYEMKTSNKEK